ncbi:MAG: sigma-54-dependent Fis family transcriptional regulator [Candidatus Rokubacteria bacterium]|nr:sigma-54-dependent Fis family transcriptional regulator [Candidatus Rokubacteria bacterium]
MKAGRILVVDDEPTMADGLRLVLEAEGHAVVTAGSVAQAVEAANGHGFHLAIVDLVLPDGDGLGVLRELKRRDSAIEVIVITAHGSIPKAVEATKEGAFYFVAKPFDPEEITALVGKALERRWLVAEATDLKRRLAKTSGYGEILGSAPAMQRVFELMDAVATSDANVLIAGESGTGKELVADAIHARSPRSQGPWVKINCAALPKDLIESELFGHVKGAFTGATTDKVGLLEEAHRGSIMLDEITEMPLDLQAKLLRVLEERLVRRIGGSRTIPVDFRLITSSNRTAEEAVKEGRLRGDLYFRINTVTITLPPLRERTGDIPLLARHYLQRFAAKHGRAVETISPEAYRRFLAHPWPGNVRELEHAIERAVLVGRGPEIGLGDLPESFGAVSDAAASAGPLPGSLEEIERASILRALESTNWNKQAAAALLGLRRPTLYSKMRKHGIPQRRT